MGIKKQKYLLQSELQIERKIVESGQPGGDSLWAGAQRGTAAKSYC